MTTHESGRVSDAIAAVEKELQRIWMPGNGEAPRSRASTANVVILAHTRESGKALSDAMVTGDVARVFVLSIDPRLPPWGLDTDVTARCRNEEATVVCAERIDVALGTAATSRAASFLDALAVAEVETVLVAVEPVAQGLLDGVSKLAQRVVLDSEALSLDGVRPFLAHQPVIIDLGWSRLLAHRQHLARCFDEPATAAVNEIESVTLHVAGEHDGEAREAQLLLGWLASRLHWKLDGKRATRKDGKRVTVTIGSEPAQGMAIGSLARVVIHAKLGDNAMTITQTLARHGESRRLETVREVTGLPRLEQVATLPKRTLAQQIDQAIARPGSDRTLRASYDVVLGASARGAA